MEDQKGPVFKPVETDCVLERLMAIYRLRLTEQRPFFAEVPYYLWGQVNYDSEGDCRSPTDRDWVWLALTNRETQEELKIAEREGTWEVCGEDPLAARAALILASRCRGEWIDQLPAAQLRGWDHEKATSRAALVQAGFESPELRPFDVGHLFWGSWKWIGWFGTEFTWVGRWIMHSVIRKDSRAVCLCIDWLRSGRFATPQSQALRYALNILTERNFSSDKEWVEWYDQGGGIREYPEPDIEQWYGELRAQFAIECPVLGVA
jgi:hypothetical protein